MFYLADTTWYKTHRLQEQALEETLAEKRRERSSGITRISVREKMLVASGKWLINLGTSMIDQGSPPSHSPQVAK